MGIEATMIVIDNSEWMRNGDYTPTRLEAQNDAVTLLFNAKTQQNPENSVGMMTMAGKNPEVLVTLTDNVGKILSALHHIKISGTASISTGVQIAQLALKHRQHKHHQQRIVVFVGSPIAEDQKTLTTIGNKLKKNNVSVDVINFGEEAENTAKLEAFIAAVNSNDNSHLVTIPPGPHILSDILLTSPIIAGEDGAPPGFAVGGGGFEFDPSLDPELALALRISLEEERARQEANAKANGAEGMQVEGTESTSAIPVTDDPELLQALQMSMGNEEDVPMEELSEEEQIKRAIEMSIKGEEEADTEENNAALMQMLGSLPGVDPNDPRIQDALNKKDDEKK